MSSGGQIVGALVGGVAGYLLPGANVFLGAQIGLMAGGYLDPPKGPTVNGPRLNDLSVQTSTYGAVIPRVYGTVTVNGNVFWLENNQIKETVTKKKSGGKGGGTKNSTRTYTYSATFAVGLCQGPIVGVRRIWVGPDLIYDAGSSDPGTIAASNVAASGFHLYTGTDTQAADARMQATLGVANTPAWRGLCYLVFYDLALAKYGNSLAGAQVRVEVLMAAAPVSWTATQQVLPASDSWGSMAASQNTAIAVAGDSGSSNRIAITHDGQIWAQVMTSTAEGRYCVAYGAGIFITMNNGDGCEKSVDDGASWSHIMSNAGQNWTTFPTNPYPPYSAYSYSGICYGGGTFVATVSGLYCGVTTDGTNWQRGTMPSNRTWGPITHNGSVFCALAAGSNYCATSADGLTWAEHSMSGSGNWNAIAWGAGLFVAVGFSGGVAIASSPDGVTWTTRVGSSLNFKGLAWSGAYFVALGYGSAQGYTSPDGINWTPLTLPANTLWRACVPFMGVTLAVSQTTDIAAYIYQSVVSSGETLSSVVSAECLQSGLLSGGDVDVSALTSSVRGYRIGSIGAIRAALEPLQAAWPFDVVQHGYVIRFVARGGASVVTIAAADLDARGAGQEPGVQITTSREMDSQMPRRVTVQHLDYDREYNTGTQYAERLNTAAINARVLDLPIVLTATEAAGKAEVLLYLYWLERYDVSVTLPPTYNQLEPGDVVTLVTPEGNVSLRLTTVNYTSDARLECRAKYASAAIYTPTAVGSSPSVTGQSTLSLPVRAICTMLDIPSVHSVQIDPVFLVSMHGLSPSWEGGVLYGSSDSGVTWTDLEAFTAPGGVSGVATSIIGSVDHRVWDNTSVLSVTLDNGEVYSSTSEAVLNGANYFAYGSDGRWEIVAVRTCTLTGVNSYAFSDMLRGRFGSEWAMSTHQVGDKVLLLSAADVTAVDVPYGALGVSRLYRAVTYGLQLEASTDVPFVYRGINLKPLSPAYSTFSRNVVTNDWSGSLFRRTRYGGEWVDYVDVPLSEATEAYEMDVFTDGSYTTVARTVPSSTPTLSYLASQQLADFGSYVNTLYYKLYQISSVVGRGYPLIGQAVSSINSEYSVQINIPSSSVSSNLTGYPVFIDLSLMSQSFWGSLAYRDGRDIRATDSSGAQIPMDLVMLDSVQKTGYMFVKTSLSSTVATVIYITCGLLANGFVAAGASNGRNAVWTNYIAVFTFGENHVNRVGSAYTTANVSTTSMSVASTSPNLTSHQGVAWDGTYYYVSGTNKLTKYTAAWVLVATNTNPLGAVGFGTNHVGDIEVVNGVVYAPVESYTSISVFSSQRIARFSAETLSYIDSVSVSAQGHEVSSIAYCPTDGYLYVSSYADGSKLWRYNLSTLSYVSSLSLSSTISQVQGVTWWKEAFWITSGYNKNTYRVEYGGNVRDSVYTASGSDDDYEGIGHTDSGLLVLVDSLNSPNNGVVRTLVPKTIGRVGSVETVAPLDQFEYVSGLSRYTTWTMGLTMKMSSKSTAMAMMTYTINGSSANADRATIAYRLSSDRLGLWNDTDTWLLDTISPVVGTTYRINASHNGTSGRKFYRDGTLTASAGTSTARPAAGANTLVMGMESWTKGEDFAGELGFAYLASTAFSDHYVAAEWANLTSPATFYSIVG